MSVRCPNEQGATPRDDAIRLLARREYSRAELMQRLTLRAHAPDVVTACLDELAESGLQSDQRFTESFLRSRVMRGQGPLKIRGELERRGIERDLIAATLSAAEQSGEVDWYALAATTLARRFNDTGSSPRERARRERFLASRGFSFDQVRHALEQLNDAN
ncbi:MAG TPA: recombination regulator RecX [Candidatus Halomonas stercoripullorum]|uniref:Regulatory protein RecX n=1 Tax=Candidatus Halomonas stercoripullorum TaxID=2838617 RepID=A0A9D1WNT3_9GAMM|nr:recombination regulator RecX [Candidatus Halomonas stercoripullorum]